MNTSDQTQSCLLVYITLPAEVDAAGFCLSLVERHLAAGMNILGPVRSVYRWDGKVREASEWAIVAQVASEAFDDFQEAVRGMHPHIVPCITGIQIATGYKPFMEWITCNSLKRPL